MKAYHYLLFRIYMFYKDTMKEGSNLLLTTSFVSTVMISINLITIYFYFNYKDLLSAIPNKYYIIGFMILIWGINYFFIIKKEDFLKRNFNKDKKEGTLVIVYIILTAFFAIVAANYNREKIFEQRKNDQKELNKHTGSK